MLLNPYRFAPSGGGGGGGGSGDPYWANVAMLVQNGVDVVTPTRNVPAVISNSLGVFDSSGAIDLVLSNASIDWHTHQIAIGSQEFTLEMWVRPTVLSSSSWQVLISTDGVAQWFELQVDNLYARWVVNGSVKALTSAHGMTTSGLWYYVAAVRSAGTLTLRCHDGYGSGSDSTVYSAGDLERPSLGRSPFGYGNFDGYLDEIRLTLGVARDVNVVPTAPFPTGP